MTSTPHTHNWFIFVTPNGPWTLDIEPFFMSIAMAYIFNTWVCPPYVRDILFAQSKSSRSDQSQTFSFCSVIITFSLNLCCCCAPILDSCPMPILDSMLLIWQFNLCLQIWSSCVCALLLISSTLSPSIPFYLLCQFIKYLFSVLSSPPPNIYF